MNRNTSSLVKALGLGLAGAAAAALAGGGAKRTRSPLGFLTGRGHFRNPFVKKALAGTLLSSPLLSNFMGGRGGKNTLLRSAMLGLSAGLGAMAHQQQRGIFNRGGFLGGRRMHGGSGLGTIGRVLAGGLVAAAASKLINKTFRDRHTHEPHTYEETSRSRRFDNEPHIHETRAQGRQSHDQSNF
jgi:hypothetical protein